MEKFLGIGYYHVRIHLNPDDYPIFNIEQFIQKYSKYYIISQEHMHFHIMMKTQELIDSRSLKKSNFRTDLVNTFKQNGNGFYSISTVRNLKQCQKYILKEVSAGGKFIYKGFTDDEISLFKKTSYLKGRDKFQEQLDLLEEQYISNRITFEDFGIEFIKLKVKYNQNIYTNHIKAMLLKYKVKKDPTYAKEIYDTMFPPEAFY